MLPVIAFDGDDTLWHNEHLFNVTQQVFRDLIGDHADGATVDEHLLETEVNNLRLFGYGVKGFTLAMIETAIQLTAARIPAKDIQSIIDMGKRMLEHPVELLDGVRPTLEALQGRYSLWLITKGDLFDQESKIARSGLEPLFDRIEIVSEKNPDTYRRLLESGDVMADRFLMVGNSLRSDILPVVEMGARAIHIPYPTTWQHEQVVLESGLPAGAATLTSVKEVPAFLESLFAVD